MNGAKRAKKAFRSFFGGSASEKDHDRRSWSDDGHEGQDLRFSGSRPLSTGSLQKRSAIPARSPKARAALTEWPPKGIALDGTLSQGKAMEMICIGAPVFSGQRRPIPHASDTFYTLYASCDGTGDKDNDRAETYHSAFNAATFRMFGTKTARYPWETLEHPSMAYCYGTRPGTITLNHWVSLSDHPHPPIQLRDPGTRPKDVTLSAILSRLRHLEGGLEDDSPDLMYKTLYKQLLKDPDRYTSPHKGMEKQIADLITVLSRPEWIDFSQPKNQVVAKFFTNATYMDQGKFRLFFHQLLLSLELDFRIHSKQHADWAQEKLLTQLPPQIAWNLAVANRWHEAMHIEIDVGDDREQIRYRLRKKKRQVKAIRKFARSMKWPNLARVDEILRERDPSAPPLETRSSDAMSYFSGVLLPGPTLPFLIMNTLIDCDSDASALTALTHMQPASGFQYKSSTYWTSTSVVGKVLAPTCQEIGGWIGPARPAPDLSRTQIARIRQRRPKQNVTISDAETMMIRSDALGPPPPMQNVTYPVQEYSLLLPDGDDIVDTVRIEKLALKSVSSASSSSPSLPATRSKSNERLRSSSTSRKRVSPPNMSSPSTATTDITKPHTFDACVQFAISGKSWPLRLSYDVNFISAYPCAQGPHPLFFDYVYKNVKVDEILTIRDWGGLNGGASFGAASSRSRSKSRDRAGDMDREREMEMEREERDQEMVEADEREKVLCIEAFGVADNEVLARAWCSHWGLSAIVTDLERTCMSCAIREAYAACITVCILVEGSSTGNDEVH